MGEWLGLWKITRNHLQKPLYFTSDAISKERFWQKWSAGNAPCRTQDMILVLEIKQFEYFQVYYASERLQRDLNMLVTRWKDGSVNLHIMFDKQLPTGCKFYSNTKLVWPSNFTPKSQFATHSFGTCFSKVIQGSLCHKNEKRHLDLQRSECQTMLDRHATTKSTVTFWTCPLSHLLYS